MTQTLPIVSAHGKRHLTRDKVRSGKLAGMGEDQSWRRLDYWERVKWARRFAGYETAREAADALGMQPVVYQFEIRPR